MDTQKIRSSFQNEILEDEFYCLAKKLSLLKDKSVLLSSRTLFAGLFKEKYYKRSHIRGIKFLSFWEDVGDITQKALLLARENNILQTVSLYSTDSNYNDPFYTLPAKEKVRLALIDCTQKEEDHIISHLKKFISEAEQTERIVIGISLPKFPTPKNDICNLGERELSYYLETLDSSLLTPEISFYSQIEKLCRQFVSSDGKNLVLLRFPYIFGPACSDRLDLISRFQEIKTSGTIKITEEDSNEKFSCVYIRDAIKACFNAFYFLESGNIYNVAGYETTKADLLHEFFIRAKQQFKLQELRENKKEQRSNTINSQKYWFTYWCNINSLQKRRAEFFKTRKSIVSEGEALYRMYCFLTNTEYGLDKALEPYHGRLPRLKEIDFQLLQTLIDICKKHNIKFFVAAGNLLGIARENKSIPWDDDLDIGMDRENYDRFCKIVPKELPPRYEFGEATKGNFGHYTFVKIRLRDTYFSMLRSSRFKMKDGVYVDVFVYDTTSDSPQKQRLHVILEGIMLVLINYKWYGFPTTTGILFYLSWPIVWILKLIPWSWIHALNRRILMMYGKRTNTAFDSVGLHMYKCGFPKKWLEEIEEADLDGMKVPVLKHRNEYLSFFYGPSFLSYPPISMRHGPHDFIRLDLGEHLFETHSEPQFRQVDLRGELFEEEFPQ